MTPVPVAPAVPTAVIERYSTLSKPASTATFSPTTMFVTEVTLMFVSPAEAAAASVVAVRCAVPTAATLLESTFERPMLRLWPTAIPPTLAT